MSRLYPFGLPFRLNGVGTWMRAMSVWPGRRKRGCITTWSAGAEVTPAKVTVTLSALGRPGWQMGDSPSTTCAAVISQLLLRKLALPFDELPRPPPQLTDAVTCAWLTALGLVTVPLMTASRTTSRFSLPVCCPQASRDAAAVAARDVSPHADHDDLVFMSIEPPGRRDRARLSDQRHQGQLATLRQSAGRDVAQVGARVAARHRGQRVGDGGRAGGCPLREQVHRLGAHPELGLAERERRDRGGERRRCGVLAGRGDGAQADAGGGVAGTAPPASRPPAVPRSDARPGRPRRGRRRRRWSGRCRSSPGWPDRRRCRARSAPATARRASASPRAG